MQDITITDYLHKAIALLRACPQIFLSLCLVGLASSLVLLARGTALYAYFNAAAVGLSILATPVFYGICYQRLTNRVTPVADIIRTYVPGYLWLLLRMYVPALVLASTIVMGAQSSNGGGYFEVTLISFSLLYLYVIPEFFRSGKQRGTILSGIRALAANFAASTPLILTVVLLEAATLLFHYYKTTCAAPPLLIEAGAEFLLYLTGATIDLILFVILLQVLEQLDISEKKEIESR